MIDQLNALISIGAQVSIFSVQLNLRGNEAHWTCKIELKRDGEDIVVRTSGTDLAEVMNKALAHFDAHLKA